MFYAGLSARYYDAFFIDSDASELLFFQQQIEHAPGPALEIGCGTGRILLPLMQRGLEVEGFDASADMLAICKEKASVLGLQPILYQQTMHDLNVHKQYGCLYSPLGTFQQLANRDDASRALQRWYDHILPGGKLVLYLYLPWYHAPAFGTWHRHDPVMVDKDTHVIVHEKAIHDPIEQQLFMRYRYRMYQQRALIAEEYNELTIRWYSRYEFELMLQAVGFKDIAVHAGYENSGPFDVMLFVATV